MAGKENRATANRKIRQEALREQLQAQGHLQHVVDIAKKLRDEGAIMEPQEMQSKKAAADIHLKLINKYLPDLKSTEVEGQIGLVAHEQWLANLE